MININASTIKMTDVDRSVVATCPLGISIQATGLSGVSAVRPEPRPELLSLLPVLPVSEGNERPTKASAAAVATAQAHAYAFAAAGAGFRKQTTQQYMWAYRGLEPWSDPA
ncbi:hypothetical protein [Streptomyces apocyni]|uniref:hypothetical protein n=1 Tax=Streptomyces apocyni TaxID=2654677 RepID=UPI0012EADA9C|nr:hypothetical protein [Streptomyces apocyni]